MRHPIYTERNWLIYWRRCSGETLAAIASDYGISRERVRQICVWHARKRRHQRFKQEQRWLASQGIHIHLDDRTIYNV